MYTNPKVLITGANGQLGQEFIEFFVDKGINFVAKNSSELDITNDKMVDAVFSKFRPKVLINCAAYTHVDEAESALGAIKADNVNNLAIAKLIDACHKFNAKLVHFSTDYIYDGETKPTAFYKEHDRPNPLNKYGLSKLLGDNELMASEIPFLLIRVAWLAGAFGANFIKAIENKIRSHMQLSIVDDQLSTPSFTHDVVEKTWKLIISEQKGVFNVASSTACSRIDYTKEMLKIWGISEKVEIIPIKTSSLKAAATRPLITPLDTTMLAKTLGEPIKTWDILLQESLNIMQKSKGK